MNSTKDVPHSNIALGIVQNIGRFWQDHEYEDFEVSVEGEIIRCHSFILVSCSEFFKNLLKSNMKEKQEMKVDLQDITLKTFQLILKTLYTGCELLTKENVLEVWSAVHQLQIRILVQHCEEFVIGNLSPETLEIYRQQAELLQSKRVSERIFKYMLEDFMTLRKTVTFLRLDFKDVYSLIESDSLVVSSEDLVLLSVYEWVNYGDIMVNDYNTDPKTTSRNTSLTWVHSSGKDIENSNVSVVNVNEHKKSKKESTLNDALNSSSALSSVNQKDGAPSAPGQLQKNQRSVYLLPLLKATRYFLLSETFISKLYRNKITSHYTQDVHFFIKSLFYKISTHVNGYLPPASLHRECSHFENVGVVCYDNKHIAAYSFAKEKWFRILNSPELNVFKLLALNDQLYACANYDNASEVFAFVHRKWVSVLKLQEEIRIFLAHDTSIYIITSQNSSVYKCKHILANYKIDVDIGDVDFAMSFYQNILVFYSPWKKIHTIVRCWDTTNHALTHLINLDFNSYNMTSFSDDRRTYILDSLGRLYEVTQLETIQFTMVDRLWRFRTKELKGTMLFGNTLLICCKVPDHDDQQLKANDVFTSTKFLKTGNVKFTSNFIPCVLLKRDLIAA